MDLLYNSHCGCTSTVRCEVAPWCLQLRGVRTAHSSGTWFGSQRSEVDFFHDVSRALDGMLLGALEEVV